MDALHRILAGQPLTPGELRIAGVLVLLWFLMDLVQWVDLVDRKISITIELNRRFFVFGSAAVIAATQIPTVIEAATKVVNSHPIDLKRINCIEMVPLTITERNDGLISLKVRRDFSSKPICNWAMNARGMFRWWALPGYEIVTIDKPLILEMETNCPAESSIWLGNNERCEYYLFSEERGLKLEGKYALLSV